MNVTLTEDQRRLLLGVLRGQIRRVEKNRDHLLAKFGDEADLTNPNARLRMFEAIYTLLGGDPEGISNRPWKER